MRPKKRIYTADIAIITNIDYEHVDFYQTWDKIKDAYAKFAECTVPGGRGITSPSRTGNERK